jgi:hypothetical protein
MPKPIVLLLTAAVFAATPALADSSPGATAAPAAEARLAEEPRQWRFRVLLDGREIGVHEFRVSGNGPEQRVEIDASFDVRFLFINAYRYRHQNAETWRDGCLSSIESSTDDNGDMLRVSGAPVGAGFGIDHHAGGRVLETACVRSFAYWDLDLFSAERLLNSQTGEFVDVRVEDRGTETLRIGDSDVPARRFALVLPDGEIDLWYGRDNAQWLALESRTEGGRLLRYEPLLLPLPLDGEARLAMR